MLELGDLLLLTLACMHSEGYGTWSVHLCVCVYDFSVLRAMKQIENNTNGFSVTRALRIKGRFS